MAILKSTQISGSLNVSENIIAQSITASLQGTASHAVSSSYAAVAEEAKSIASDVETLTVNKLHVKSDGVIDGDLEVKGTLSYVGTEDLRVKDKHIELNVTKEGSAAADADGAGITIKGTRSQDAKLYYRESDDSMVLNKNLAFESGAYLVATASEAQHAVSASRAINADSASVADKVKFALKFADNNSIVGPSGSALSNLGYDGSQEVTIQVSTDWLAKQHINHADSASKVDNKLTVASDVAGRLSIDHDFDGASAATISLDLHDITDKIAENKASASAELAAASQSISSSIVTVASASSAALNDFSASVAADFEAVKSGSTEALEEFSASVATDFSASDAARVALSESVASSSAAFSASVAADFSASYAHVNEVSSSLSSSINALSSSVEAAYVKKAGDTMTGDLNMGNNTIQLGDMKLVWSTADQALTFVVEG